MKNQAGDVTGVVAVGTELTVLDQILADIIKNILSVLVVLILLFCIFFEEVLSFLEEGKKYQEAEKETKKASPCHLMRLIIFGVFVAYNMTVSFLPVYLMRYVQNAHFGNTRAGSFFARYLKYICNRSYLPHMSEINSEAWHSKACCS